MNNHVSTMTGARSIIKEFHHGLLRLLVGRTGRHEEGSSGKWKEEGV
ncbi:MAG: hypothetical protein ACRD2L_22785 [Terriglobia bacterium]